MNRDIKFRVWSEKNKKMLEVQKHSFKTGLSMPYGSNMECYFGNLMRYTGLKDISEKEIYEGDIVSFYNDEEYKFKSTNALVIYDSAVFMLEHKKLGEEYLGEMDIENMCIKIIGNIYENPELLEGEK
ncbi:YopX family protein [Clostridium perfringens]|uniref:YopX family protein n=1 Tax=Clostridium perfringens TaxID=1502 RepID=UPI0024BCDCE2|nr:YopX family protein [Clostridium perfringens]MDU2085986.1 YopX family protein [Clostridium perfringens]MDU8977383.1 YopX family protein [Clostridium perfringens]